MTVTPLSNQDLQHLMAAEPDLLLLDVRTPEEYQLLGHIPGATLLPIHLLPNALGTLDPNRKTVLICEHGVRSADAGHYLAHHGFRHLYNLTAGMAEWNGPRAFASEEPTHADV